MMKSEKILAMFDSGERNYERIAAIVGSTPNGVRDVLSKNRRRKNAMDVGEPVATFRPPVAIEIEAKKRGISTRAFVILLLNTIAADNLFAAVLDDERAA